MSSLGRFVCLLVMLALMCGSAPAQQNAGAGRANWDNLKRLKSDARIVVKTKLGAEYEGNYKGTTDDALLLTRVEGAPTAYIEVKREEVQEVRKLRSKFVSGAIGTALGVGIGIGAGVAIGAGIDARSKSNEDKGLAPVLFGFFGGLFGAPVGGKLIGKKLRKGKKIYIAQ